MLASGRKSEEKRRERRIGEGESLLIRMGLLWKSQRKTVKIKFLISLFHSLETKINHSLLAYS
jgi:hypothetical protein